jgi:hypothetical protein
MVAGCETGVVGSPRSRLSSVPIPRGPPNPNCCQCKMIYPITNNRIIASRMVCHRFTLYRVTNSPDLCKLIIVILLTEGATRVNCAGRACVDRIPVLDRQFRKNSAPQRNLSLVSASIWITSRGFLEIRPFHEGFFTEVLHGPLLNLPPGSPPFNASQAGLPEGRPMYFAVCNENGDYLPIKMKQDAVIQPIQDPPS